MSRLANILNEQFTPDITSASCANRRRRITSVADTFALLASKRLTVFASCGAALL